MDNFLLIFEYVILAIFALGWGSFATMAVYRLAHDEPWIGKKPYCPECLHDLKFIDYISLLSYFLYRGKCRYCGAHYSYHNVYFMTELLILIFFIFNHYVNGFSETFIINSGIIVVSVIWSIIFFTKGISQNKMMLSMLFFAAIKRVYLDATIYPFIYGAIVAFIVAITIRHLYYFAKGEFEKSKDYLEYKPEDRFKNINFLIVKMAIVWGVALGYAQISLYVVASIAFVMLLFRDIRKSLPVLANLMLVLILLEN